MIETLPPQPAACLVPSSTSFFLSRVTQCPVFCCMASPLHVQLQSCLHHLVVMCAERGAGVARVISRAKQQGFSAVQPFLVRKRVSISEVGTKSPRNPTRAGAGRLSAAICGAFVQPKTVPQVAAADGWLRAQHLRSSQAGRRASCHRRLATACLLKSSRSRRPPGVQSEGGGGWRRRSDGCCVRN